MNLKHEVAAALLAGVLLGVGVNFAYFTFFRPPSSWHFTTSFLLAGHLMSAYGIEVASPKPNVYNGSGPWFEIKADLWRITWKTVEYFKNQSSGYRNYFLYFVAPLDIGVRKEGGFYDSGRVARVEIPEDAYRVYSMPSYEAVRIGNLTSYYKVSDSHYYVNGYPLLMTGKGTHFIGVNGIGCFNITIEEYY